ncbi:MAG TPA: prepilin-type N-terminal cleavage/methylation domain-containing protein [Pyrinomonadaceae bacterium]|nr:prepilin-type N-terminal cleavage/methylation domain-containing protein [Pyrinomonadaceae bacterium]
MKTKNVKTQNAKGQRGFTLVETSIASVVMMVGALAVSSLFVFSTQNNVGGGERALAMAVAQQQLEQLRSVNYEDTTLTAGTTTSTVRNGARNYTVQRVVVDETNANLSSKGLKKITITVTPITAGANWLRSPVVLTSYRSTLAAGTFAVSE